MRTTEATAWAGSTRTIKAILVHATSVVFLRPGNNATEVACTHRLKTNATEVACTRHRLKTNATEVACTHRLKTNATEVACTHHRLKTNATEVACTHRLNACTR
jgi:hypothetical protein